MVTRTRTLAGLLFLGCAACGVEATGSDTGGVVDAVESGCPSGISVLMTDFASTQLALSGLEGDTRSESLVSTASTETAGLAFALSGDVVLPSTAPRAGTAVLVDRFGTNVLSWVNTKTGEVENQLPVGTGFESNPQDYLEVDERRAFVSRWGQNNQPGRQPLDEGGDLLVIDRVAAELVGRIPMPTPSGLPPRPGGLLGLGSEVLVSLDPISEDFAITGAAMLVGVSMRDERVSWELTFSNLKSCGRPSRSPSGRLLALACSGALDPEGQVESVAQSALLLLDAEASPPLEVARFGAEEIAGEPLQGDAVFASDDIVLLKTQSPLGQDVNNRWLAFHLDGETTEELLEAEPDEAGRGKGLVYGDMLCTPGCSDICLLADADQGVLQRVEVAGQTLRVLDPVRVEERVGLPPRGLALRK